MCFVHSVPETVAEPNDSLITQENMKHSLKAKINDLKGNLMFFKANFYKLKAKTQV